MKHIKSHIIFTLLHHSRSLLRHSRAGGNLLYSRTAQLKKQINFTPRGVASMAEIVIVAGIFVFLMSLGIFSFTRFQNSSSLTSVTDTFISDFKNQQIKAMQGDTESGAAPADYGIHFESTSYTLFRGSYSAGDPNNFTVNLPPNIKVTAWKDSTGEEEIIFWKGDGHIRDYNATNVTISFNDTAANIGKTISLSYWGATSIN